MGDAARVYLIVAFVPDKIRFPRLLPGTFTEQSPVDNRYNCIAWAAEENSRWWWPSDFAYWPASVPREETLEAFKMAFRTLGYAPCPDEGFEEGFQKVAIFAIGNTPTHAALQMKAETWASKLGRNVDIFHQLRAIGGGLYGEPILFLRKAKTKID